MNFRHSFLSIVSFSVVIFGSTGELMAQKNTNFAKKQKSGIFAGEGNLILSNARQSFIGSGYGNTLGSQAEYSGIVGGYDNAITNQYGFVGGGANNLAGGYASVVGGGQYNTATGSRATIPGGEANTASGNWSLAAGAGAEAIHNRAFVWSSGGTTASTNTNSFTVRATGGARFITATNLVGAILESGATAWAVLSDSNAKTSVEAVEPREILAKLAALPVTSWSYKHDPQRRYIGPMAQDFHAAFGLGNNDTTITTLDTDGVTLAAIQGLVQELGVQLSQRDAKIAELEAKLQRIDEKLEGLPPAP